MKNLFFSLFVFGIATTCLANNSSALNSGKNNTKLTASYISPKLLSSLSQAVPEKIWLSDIKMIGAELHIQGRAGGNSQVSDLMRNLDQTKQFTSTILAGSRVEKGTTGTEMTHFEIVATVR